jgi:hypothetical protein
LNRTRRSQQLFAIWVLASIGAGGALLAWSICNQGSQVTNLVSQTLHLLPGDETILKYLGAAAVLQWHGFPEAVQVALLRQAESVGGLPLAGDLQEEIKALIRRTRT